MSIQPDQARASQDVDDEEIQTDKEKQKSRREINFEKFIKYAEKAYASEGFDVDSDNDSDVMGEIGPCTRPGEEPREYVLEAANFAIREYNKNEGCNIELVKIVKSNYQFVKGAMHYITLEAREAESNGVTKTYEAKVYVGIKDDGWNLEIFRERASS